MITYLPLLPLIFLPSFLLRFHVGFFSFNLLDLLLLFSIIKNGTGLILFFKTHLKSSTVQASLFFIFLGLCASFIAPNHALALGAWKSWIVLPILYAYTLQTLRFKPEQIAWSLLIGVTISSVYGFYLYATHPLIRFSSWYDSPNFFAMISVPILLMNWVSIPKNKYRKNILALIIFTSVAVLLSQSISGIITYAIGLFCIFTANREKALFIKYIGLVAIVLGILVPLFTPTNTTLTQGEGRSESLKGRSQIWQVARNGITQSPLLGIGLRQFEFFYTKNIGKVTSSPVENNVPEPHNLSFGLILNLGLIGFLLFYGLNLFAFQKGKPIFTIILLAALVHGITDTTYFQNDLAVLTWTALVFSTYG